MDGEPAHLVVLMALSCGDHFVRGVVMNGPTDPRWPRQRQLEHGFLSRPGAELAGSMAGGWHVVAGHSEGVGGVHGVPGGGQVAGREPGRNVNDWPSPVVESEAEQRTRG